MLGLRRPRYEHARMFDRPFIKPIAALSWTPGSRSAADMERDVLDIIEQLHDEHPVKSKDRLGLNPVSFAFVVSCCDS